ncbi:MAG: tripartite tricarboxylate transporter TctB family protein [Rhodospirillaceae bacterium]
MVKLRFAASAISAVFLLSLCCVLAAPAFELPTLNAQGSIGAGGFPQFTVIAVGVLAPLMLVQDALRFRREMRGGTAGGDSGQARRMVVLGATVFALLAAYIFFWQILSFLPASILFTAVLCCLLLPAEKKTRRGYLTAAVFSVLFCTGVWAVFVHLLAVPLR